MDPDSDVGSSRGCCYTCIKYVVFIFNLLFALVGCLLLAGGIWLVVSPGLMGEPYEFDMTMVDPIIIQIPILAYCAIAVGSFILLTGLLGCCGAIRESQCMLATCFVFLTIIFVCVAFLAAIFWYAIAQVDILINPLSSIGPVLQDAVDKYHNPNEPAAKILMDRMQTSYSCCGAGQGQDDYVDNNKPVPETCKPAYYEKPCTDTFNNLILLVMVPGVVATAIALYLLLAMIHSCCLCCKVRLNTHYQMVTDRDMDGKGSDMEMDRKYFDS